jgi:hypothetical protein
LQHLASAGNFLCPRQTAHCIALVSSHLYTASFQSDVFCCLRHGARKGGSVFEVWSCTSISRELEYLTRRMRESIFHAETRETSVLVFVRHSHASPASTAANASVLQGTNTTSQRQSRGHQRSVPRDRHVDCTRYHCELDPTVSAPLDTRLILLVLFCCATDSCHRPLLPGDSFILLLLLVVPSPRWSALVVTDRLPNNGAPFRGRLAFPSSYRCVSCCCCRSSR